MAQGPLETEVKIAIPDSASIRSRLEAAGLRVSVPRVFEANTVYDTADGALRSRGCVLRIRTAGPVTTITFKGPGVPGEYKVRPETEFTASDPESVAAVFTQLGYQPLFRYEKYRTEYSDSTDQGVVTLDETPIGTYLELEGQTEWIDASARRLGFAKADYITMSYGALYLAHCERESVRPGDMTFSGSTDNRGTF